MRLFGVTLGQIFDIIYPEMTEILNNEKNIYPLNSSAKYGYIMTIAEEIINLQSTFRPCPIVRGFACEDFKNKADYCDKECGTCVHYIWHNGCMVHREKITEFFVKLTDLKNKIIKQFMIEI